ncbi:hypothetical protein GQF40_09955, partial [Neisseria meningitidis]|nr:hypothetical protein [Neisseria meningitidis]MBG9039067.1 hypothetical protein [Neisseria meningitidis]MBG9075500.1 hypothetical protein [Neisseria meningitidis]MBG9077600.1 hypothetical protein [Neisseria meningitidis]MBG9110482.1 hypothetical protein [Neisseria meningitidis]
KKNTWLRNAKCFILESVPTTNTLVLHLKSESKAVLVMGRSRECKKCFIKIMGVRSFVYQWNNLRLDSEIV